MEFWLAQNIGTVMSWAALLVGGGCGWAYLRSRVSRLEEHDKQRDDQKKELEDQLKELRVDITSHHKDTTLHIDPRRDEKIWDELKGEMRAGFERLEKKVERLMVYTTPPAGS